MRRFDTPWWMSIPVALEQLRAASDERGGRAYLLTVTDDARRHAVHLALRLEGDALAADVGNTAATPPPAPVSLYPAQRLDEYSLIVDGTAVVEANRLTITPTKAVLHRPAATPDPTSSCSADCVPLDRILAPNRKALTGERRSAGSHPRSATGGRRPTRPRPRPRSCRGSAACRSGRRSAGANRAAAATAPPCCSRT